MAIDGPNSSVNNLLTLRAPILRFVESRLILLNRRLGSFQLLYRSVVFSNDDVEVPSDSINLLFYFQRFPSLGGERAVDLI